MEQPQEAVIEGVRDHALIGMAEMTLASGVRVRVRPIASGLLESVLSRIPDPAVPKQTIKETGREEENPFDPAYLSKMAEAARARSKATIDAVVMICFQLIDGMPPDEAWMPGLRMLEKLGHLDLSGYDLTDLLVKEFVFKRHIAVSSEDVNMALDVQTIRREVVAQATRGFRGSEARPANP